MKEGEGLDGGRGGAGGSGRQGEGMGRREWEGQEEEIGREGGSGMGRRNGNRREGQEGWKQEGGCGSGRREGEKGQSVTCQLPVYPPSCSGDGSATSGASEEVKSPAAMAQAVKVHQDTSRVMYFA